MQTTSKDPHVQIFEKNQWSIIQMMQILFASWAFTAADEEELSLPKSEVMARALRHAKDDGVFPAGFRERLNFSMQTGWICYEYEEMIALALKTGYAAARGKNLEQYFVTMSNESVVEAIISLGVTGKDMTEWGMFLRNSASFG